MFPLEGLGLTRFRPASYVIVPHEEGSGKAAFGSPFLTADVPREGSKCCQSSYGLALPERPFRGAPSRGHAAIGH